MRIPIFTDEADQQGGWHGKVLATAFQARGVEPVFITLQDCVIDLSQAAPRIRIPSFNENPRGAFVRGVAGGTLQQVITRLNVLHMLEMQGVRIYNSGKAIERTVDKAMTSFLLGRANIASPATWVCESRHHAHHIISEQLPKNRLIIKPLFGSQGKGVRLVQPNVAMPLPMDAYVDGVFYLQQFIDSGAQSHDFRVLVVDNQAVAAMRRSGDTWINNVAQGAKCEALNLQDIHAQDILQLAEQAAKALQIDYCGVDIMRDTSGKLWVLEVNSIPAWAGLQSVSGLKITQILADSFLNNL